LQRFAIPAKSFHHVVHEVKHREVVCRNNLPRDCFDYNDTILQRWATAVMIILPNAVEDYMQGVFTTAAQLTAISSQTIMLL
jgi:hypothetical protein